jgi:hypothetical protein
MHSIRVTILGGIFLFCFAAIAPAQDAAPAAPANPATPAAPASDDAIYSNECLALTYRLPEGWKFAHMREPATSNPSKQKTLFRLRKASADSTGGSLDVSLLQVPLQHPDLERLATLFAMTFVQTHPSGNKVTREAYPVTIAGRRFSRSDLISGDKLAAVFVTWYRGYVVLIWAFGRSSEDLDATVNTLQQFSFGEDQRTADCLAPAN